MFLEAWGLGCRSSGDQGWALGNGFRALGLRGRGLVPGKMSMPSTSLLAEMSLTSPSAADMHLCQARSHLVLHLQLMLGCPPHVHVQVFFSRSMPPERNIKLLLQRCAKFTVSARCRPAQPCCKQVFLADFVQRFKDWQPTAASKGKEGNHPWAVVIGSPTSANPVSLSAKIHKLFCPM